MDVNLSLNDNKSLYFPLNFGSEASGNLIRRFVTAEFELRSMIAALATLVGIKSSLQIKIILFDFEPFGGMIIIFI